MVDAHEVESLFCDLDPLLQEKSFRVNEIYTNIQCAYTDIERLDTQNVIALTSGPVCGCIVDGFKKMTGEMKYRINVGHFVVADHMPLFSCRKCKVVTQECYERIH